MDINEIKQELKQFFCDDLGIEPDDVDYDTPLLEDGLGFDSVDALEVIAYADRKYGVSMSGAQKENFYSIDAIAAFIAAHVGEKK